MEIRAFGTQDARAASMVIAACFAETDLGGHTKQGIQMQMDTNTPEKLLDRLNTVDYFVATIDGRVVAICGHDRERIRTFFVDPRHQGHGIGGQLLRYVLEHATEQGIARISTWSTYFAREFYSHFGFEEVGEICLPEGKADIRLVEMSKALAP